MQRSDRISDAYRKSEISKTQHQLSSVWKKQLVSKSLLYQHDKPIKIFSEMQENFLLNRWNIKYRLFR